MANRHRLLLRFLPLGAICALELCSCGGGGSSVSAAGPAVTASSNFVTAVAQANPGTSSGGNATTIPITMPGLSQNATLPANETVPSTGVVSFFPNVLPIFPGLILPAASSSKVHSKPLQAPGSQGEVDVDSNNTGLTVGSGGQLSGFLVLVPGIHSMKIWGPLAIADSSGNGQLSISGYINLLLTVGPDGVVSMPTSLTVRLPQDGGRLSGCNFAATFPIDYIGQTVAINIADSITQFSVSNTIDSNGNVTVKFQGKGLPEGVPRAGIESLIFGIVGAS